MKKQDSSHEKKTQEYYDAQAESFSASRDNLVWDAFDLVKNQIRESDSVLDIGCGSGRLIEALGIAPSKYVGVDNSPGMLAQAKKRHPHHIFYPENILELHTLNEKFDCVVLIASFHHIMEKEQHGKILKKIKRLLNENGKIIMTNWYLYDDPPMKKIQVHKSGKHSDWYVPAGDLGRWYYGFTREELDDLLINAGFKIIQSTIVGKEKTRNLVHVAQLN